eukprot:tig00000478_g1266.t1
MSNEAVAFGIAVGAGLATVLGSLLVLVPIAAVSRRFLACGLAFSTGVMIQVTYVELWGHAVDEFKLGMQSETLAFGAATGAFFLGMLVIAALGAAVHRIYHEPSLEEVLPDPEAGRRGGPASASTGRGPGDERLAASAPLERRAASRAGADGGSPAPSANDLVVIDVNKARPAPRPSAARLTGGPAGAPRALNRTAIIAGIAIVLHNIPEGFVSFVATVADAKVGFSIGLAVAMHNIPEGLCVAVPMVHATGSKWRALAWGLVLGLSEPLGAGIGWAIFANVKLNPLAVGFVFAMVGGMMVFICVFELFPTALRCERNQTLVCSFVILGFAVMSLSLVLFTL